jgi:hypothetical protein
MAISNDGVIYTGNCNDSIIVDGCLNPEGTNHVDLEDGNDYLKVFGRGDF